MTTIFECETAVGKCYCDQGDGELQYAEPDYALIYACTVARLNGHRGMIKVEQHCLLRQNGRSPNQPWIQPAIRLEPAMGPREHLVESAQRWHAQFVERVRTQIPEAYFV